MYAVKIGFYAEFCWNCVVNNTDSLRIIPPDFI